MQKASDDLLQLSGNPFAAVLNAAGNNSAAAAPQNNSNFGGAPFATEFSNANGRKTNDLLSRHSSMIITV